MKQNKMKHILPVVLLGASIGYTSCSLDEYNPSGSTLETVSSSTVTGYEGILGYRTSSSYAGSVWNAVYTVMVSGRYLPKPEPICGLLRGDWFPITLIMAAVADGITT